MISREQRLLASGQAQNVNHHCDELLNIVVAARKIGLNNLAYELQMHANGIRINANELYATVLSGTKK